MRNSVMLIGIPTSDPIVNEKGEPEFFLRVVEKIGNEDQIYTFPCVVRNKNTKDRAVKFIQCGKKIAVAGRAETYAIEDSNSKWHSCINVIVDDFFKIDI